jgi:nucleoporin p58/p45
LTFDFSPTRVLQQIERKLTSAAQQVQHTPQGQLSLMDSLMSLRRCLAITATLEAQNTSFIALANKIAALDTDLQRLKALYTQLWRAKTGSMRDPFSQLDRGSGGEFGVESLYGK